MRKVRLCIGACACVCAGRLQAYAASAPEEPTFLMEHQVYRGTVQSASTSSLPADFFQPQVPSAYAPLSLAHERLPDFH